MCFEARFDLGVAFRMRYGELLKGFNTSLPVFRTTSEGELICWHKVTIDADKNNRAHDTVSVSSLPDHVQIAFLTF